MEGSILTISLGIWMELPGVNYRDITPEKRRYYLNNLNEIIFKKIFTVYGLRGVYKNLERLVTHHDVLLHLDYIVCHII